jgi:hypothetical protein
MTPAVWTSLIDVLGTVAIVVAGLTYLAWDRWLNVIEDRQPPKGRFDEDLF